MTTFRHAFFAMIFFLMATIPVMAQKTIWTGDDLKDKEIRSLNELFTTSTSWLNATNDDVGIHFSRNGLAGPGGAWWPVFLNGNRLDIGAWNTKSLNMIPVSIAQVDSVVLIENPMLYKGVFTEKGGIFIYTKIPEEGLRAEGGILMGNRSGDPGPFVYTDMASRNVERLGPMADAHISYKKGNYGIMAGYKEFTQAVTDPLQLRRITPLQFGGNPYRHAKIRSSSLFLRGDVDTRATSHSIQFGTSEATDFLFTGLHGIEIPVDRNWSLVSLNGMAGLSEKYEIDYQLKYSLNEIKEYPNKDDGWLRWNQSILAGKASLSHSFGAGRQEAGFGFDLLELEDEQPSSNKLKTNIYRVFHRFEIPVTERFVFFSNLLGVSGNDNNIAFKGNTRFQVNISDSHLFSLDLTYSERLPEEDNSLWYWMAEKGFASDTLSTYRPVDFPDKIRFLQAKLEWSARISDFLKTEAAFVINKNQNEYLLQYNLVPNNRGFRTGSYEFIHDLGTSFITFPLAITTSIMPEMSHTLEYTWRKQIEGNEELFDMMPEHQLAMYLNWKPVQSFKIWSKVHAQSGTGWASADLLNQMEVRINPNQTFTFNSSIKSRFQWDLGIRKDFWDQRVAASLEAVNILNHKYRNSPISPEHAFTVYFNLRLKFLKE